MGLLDRLKQKLLSALANTKGELLYFDTIMKVLISVAVGALLLYLSARIVTTILLPSSTDKWEWFVEFAKSFQS